MFNTADLDLCYLRLFWMIVEVLSLLKFVFLLSCLWGRNKEKISWQAERTSYVCLPRVKGVLSSLSVPCRSTWPSGISYSSWRRGIWSSCITCTVTASLWSCGSSWPPGSRARTGELPTTGYDIRDKELSTLEVCVLSEQQDIMFVWFLLHIIKRKQM